MIIRKERRRYSRTRKQGKRELTISYQDSSGNSHGCIGTLYDFSEGRMGMDSPVPFEVGSEIYIHADPEGSVYSVKMDAKARVAYCHKTGTEQFRVGVGFFEVTYRHLEDEPQAAVAAA